MKPKDLTTKQLAKAALRTVKQMTSEEKAEVRKHLDARFAATPPPARQSLPLPLVPQHKLLLDRLRRDEPVHPNEVNAFLFWRGLRPCPHSFHSSDEEFERCLQTTRLN